MGTLSIVNTVDKSKQLLIDKFIEFYKIQLTKKEQTSFNDLLNKVNYYFDLSTNNEDVKKTLKKVYENINSFNFIISCLEPDKIQEYIFNNNQSVMKDKSGTFLIEEVSNLSIKEYELALETLAYLEKVDWNFKNPFASFKVVLNQNEFRATLVHSSLTSNNQTKLFLRSIYKDSFSFNDFNLTSPAINIISKIITNKKNIIVTGSTSSGKTSFMKTMLSQVKKNEHVIILEDTHELNFSSANFTHLLASSHEGKTLKDFCSYSLRMRPDRIILGEIRSSEVIPFILSMNTGHKGMMASLHANGPSDTVQRLATLFSLYSHSSQINYEVIMKLLCQSMDYIIHLENRSVHSISRVMGIDGLTPIIQNIYDEKDNM